MGRPWMLSTSIDLASLPPVLASQIEDVIAKYNEGEDQFATWQRILDYGTDAEIEAHTKRDLFKNAPIVPVSTYDGEDYPGNDRVSLVVPYRFSDHPRRFVAQRGSKLVRYARHSWGKDTLSPNGWLVRVFERIVRMDKRTLTSRDEITAYVIKVTQRISARHRTVTAAFYAGCKPDFNHGDDTHLVLMRGRWVRLKPEEYKNVEMMQKVIRKAQKLEDRLALLKQARKERADGNA